MFTTEELQSIDRNYFTVIVTDAHDVTLISNNTRHVWYIHNVFDGRPFFYSVECMLALGMICKK